MQKVNRNKDPLIELNHQKELHDRQSCAQTTQQEYKDVT